jgi:methylthioribose-1-phosphate isomerase
MAVPVPLRWSDDPVGLILLDQRRLPGAEVELRCADVAELVGAIADLAVRGAPLLGIAGGYGVALAALTGCDVPAAGRALAAARPTAVNLAWAVNRVVGRYLAAGGDPAVALAEARLVAAEDAAASQALVRAGLALVPAGARVLTHCNTGRLVSGGPGTALGIAVAAHQQGRLAMLWIDETRPLLQGARLTAWEARRAGLPYRVLVDAAAGSLFGRDEVDLVLVGADRIAADGSVANKVGTYPLAVLARHHNVPFIVAAPTSTVDLATPDGRAIPVEQRSAAEVLGFGGQAVAPDGSPAYNPAFDVTPPELVTALVTEVGVLSPVDRPGLAAQVGHPAAQRPHSAAGWHD